MPSPAHGRPPYPVRRGPVPGPPGPGGFGHPPHGPHFTQPGSTVRFLPPSPPGRYAPVWQQAPRAARPARPEPDVTTGLHRPHWLTVPLRAAVVALVFLAMPGVVLLNFGVLWVLFLTLSVGFAAGAYSLLSWWNTTFGLNGDHLVVHTGLVRRLSREIPLSRLQAVDVVRPLLMQVLGLAELRVELAGGDQGEIRLRYLGRRTADRLRASLLAHAAGLSGRTPEAPEWPFYRLRFGLLLGALAFRIPVLAAFVLFLLLTVAGFAFVEPGVLGGMVPLLLGLMRSFLGPLLRYTDFYASLSPDGLRLRYGVFQARMQTVPPGRVQAVRIVEPLLWRSLGVVRVEANVAGYVGERQMDSSTLLPVVPRRLAFSLVDELFPGTDATRVALHPARRGLSRNDALGVDDSVVVTRSGLFCTVIDIVPHARTQTVRLTAGPLARRRGVAAVEVDTPPGPVRARAAGRDLAEARRVVDGLAQRGHDSRSSTAGPERWATRSAPQDR
ncbi:PH domain-containing protein [Marinactinospora rubrisoli]|uniref:PH domain-containing protein n=1 Tax=Marinactinospora rubrisoli TaxID=2715399 RepID=A0ABW2KH40_9ACTN